jgi:alpha-tubulin suppressor-like RCC1 family protein
MEGEGLVVRSDSMEALASETVLYSWGRTDLGCLFLADVAENQLCEPAPRRSKYSKKNFTCVCSVTYHSVGVTSTGEVYGCGVNEDGQVLHDRPEGIFMHPILVEPLLSQRVVQASCGENHTGCLTASGAVVTFGCNEVRP